MGQGIDGQCDPIADAGFSHQLRDLHFHRALFDPQGFADLAIGVPTDQQVEHFSFALSEDQWIPRPEVAGRPAR